MTEPTSKRCSDCHIAQPLSEFYRRSVNGNGGPPKTLLGSVQPRCKTCSNRARVRERRRHTGVTHDQYEAMLAAQCGFCALCGQEETSRRAYRTVRKAEGERHLNVDHDHRTGRVRDLLCSRCNTALGLLGDDPALLRWAADYVEEHRR